MYEVRQRFQLPDLERFLPQGGVVDRTTEQWEVRHFDTPDGELALAGLSLTETIAADGASNWQIAVDDRVLVQINSAGGTDRSVPTPFTDLLRGAARGHTLRQTGSFRTQQLRLVLRDASGTALGQVIDEHVSGSQTQGHIASLSEHRTVRAESDTPGFDGPIKSINRAIVDNGGRPLHRQDVAANSPRQDAGSPGATSALTTYLRAQDSALLAGDLALRRGDFAVVHQLRVTVRRLRSTLRNFPGCFTSDTGTFDDDLRWYAGILGVVRDAQVMLERLDSAIEALPDDLVLGPVRARVTQHLSAELAGGHTVLTQTLTDERYIRLLAQSARWAAGTQYRPSPKIGRKELVRAGEHSSRTADRRLRAAVDADDEGAGLHRARKAAKRARYAAELLRGLVGDKASKKVVKKYRHRQDLLGAHQDALVAAELLRRLGAARGIENGENGFTYGVLYGQQLREAESVRSLIRELV